MSGAGKRPLLALGVLVAFAVAVALMWTVTKHREGRLLDGTRVVLKKVSYGTNQTLPKAPLESLFGWMPPNWSGRFHWYPSSGTSSSSDRPIFSFWLSCSRTSAATQSITYAIADEHGFECPMIFTGLY